DFGRRVALALNLDGGHVVRAGDDFIWNALRFVLDLRHAAAHEALDGEHGVLGIGDGLALGDLTDETLAVLRESDDGGGRATAFGVRDHDRVTAFHDRDDGVRRPEIDANDFIGHCFLYVLKGRRPGEWPPERPLGMARTGPGFCAKLAGFGGPRL